MTQLALITLIASMGASLFALKKTFKKPAPVQIIQMKPKVLIGETYDLIERKQLMIGATN